MVTRDDALVSGALEQADEAARAAAAHAGVEVRELHELDELRAAADLFHSVWGTAAGAPISSDLLRAFAHTGNYVAGVKRGSTLVGASVGFLGHAGSGIILHSHITGLAVDTQDRGLGFALKLHQRAWAVAHGLDVVTWTFDPLVRRNAYFNLKKLGAQADAFHVNFYGPMDDSLNAGDESDRCAVTWHITGDRAAAAITGTLGEPDITELRARGGVVLLDEDSDGRPRTHASSGELRLCWIPADIVALRSTAPDAARDWRVALRDTLGASIRDGFVARGMTRGGWYVLEPQG